MLSVRLFGPPQITYDDHPVTITRRKSRALIYYLAAHPTPLTRDQLLGFFWPDHHRPTAQQNLRATLYGLRKILGALLLVDDDTLALAAETRVDTHIFEAHLSLPTTDLSHLQETLDLYRGDFLSGFTLPDLPEFDDWVMLERERYRRLAVGGLIRFSQLYEGQQDYRTALETLERALAFDPLQEDLQRLALRLHYLAGDRAGAIRRYESFRQLLADDMGVPPMEETRALYDAIITDTLLPALNVERSTLDVQLIGRKQPTMLDVQLSPFNGRHINALPFVGRAVELQTLQELAKSPQLVLIEGEAGIGKSRLIEQFIQNQPHPVLALVGQARELESILPYQPLIEALRGALFHPDWPTWRLNLNLASVWQTEAARLLPELASAIPDLAITSHALDEIRLWEGVSQFLLALARQLPLILALDDLHWADSSTLGLLGYLIRKTGQYAAPISFVAATRPTGPRSPLATLRAALLREDRLERLNLHRLSLAEITLLAQQVSPPPQAESLATWLAQRSEGNPFILAELVRYAREHHLLLPEGRLDLSSGPEAVVVPQTVYSLIQTRLARLSEEAWRILNVAAVIGREFEFDLVARAAALSDSILLDSLDELERLGLIQPLVGARYRFDHHLTLEVVAQEIGEPRQRLFHRRVAEALESLYPHRLDALAGLLAQHYAAGHIPERAAPYAFRAGQRAADLAAWSEAITFFEQALAESASFDDSSLHLAILTALGQACLQAGQFAKASEALRRALNLAKINQNQVNEGVLYLSLAEALLLENRFSEVRLLAEEISADNRLESAINAAYLQGVALSHSCSDLAGAIAQVQKAEALLSQSDLKPATAPHPVEGVVTLGQIKFELGNLFARRGDLPMAIKQYREGIEVTRGQETDLTLRRHILLYNNLAYHLHLLHDPAAAEYAHMGLSLAQEKGILSILPYLWSTLGEIALAQNDLADAEQHFNEGLSLAQQSSVPERIAGLTANLGLVARQRGQRELAIEHLSAALTKAEALNIRFLTTQIRLWLVPLLPPAEARSHLAAARRVAEQDGYERLLAEVTRLEVEIQSD